MEFNYDSDSTFYLEDCYYDDGTIYQGSVWDKKVLKEYFKRQKEERSRKRSHINSEESRMHLHENVGYINRRRRRVSRHNNRTANISTSTESRTRERRGNERRRETRSILQNTSNPLRTLQRQNAFIIPLIDLTNELDQLPSVNDFFNYILNNNNNNLENNQNFNNTQM